MRRFGLRVGKEPRQPRAETVELLRGVAETITPDDTSLSGWYQDYADTHLRRLAFDVDLVRGQVAADARLLEVGSTPPLFTAAMAQAGFDIRGVDLRPDRFGTAITTLGLDVATCDIENEPLPYGDGAFDAVVFFEIFEHLRINPIATLREVRRVLDEGGRLLLSTPNLRSLNGLFNFVVRNKAYSCTSDVYTQYEKLEKLGHMGHVREYTPREVVEFLQRVGFAPTSIIYRGGYDEWIRRGITVLVPSLRPFVTVVADR